MWLQRLRPHFWWLLLGLVLAILQSVLAVPVVWLLRWSFDQYIPLHHTRELLGAGLALLILRSVSCLAAYLSQSINLTVTRQFSAELRRDLLDKVWLLPRQYYQQSPAGAVQDVLVNESERIEVMMRALLSQVLPSALLALALALMLMVLQIKLFLVMLLVWPATWLLNEYFRRRTVASTRTYNRVFRNYGQNFQWLLGALDFVRIQHAEGLELERGRQCIEELCQAARPMTLLNVAYLQIQTVLLTCVSLVVLLVGGTQVAEGRLSLGQLMAFFVVVGLLNTALRDMAAGLYHVIIGYESLAGIQDLLAASASLPYTGQETPDLRESLELRGVSFSYRKDQPLLQNLDLKIAEAGWTALIGPNGSGKSTVLSLILGFLRPDQGQLLADSVPYDRLDIGQLRSQLGVVPQDPVLFVGTILENVRYGHPAASVTEVTEALRLAAAELWVHGLPLGLETIVGDSGQLISGGQRQRLAIARALLGSPRFLILDEPTNHLDAQAVGQILENLAALPQRPGVLMVTHDDAIARMAQQVYRLHSTATI